MGWLIKEQGQPKEAPDDESPFGVSRQEDDALIHDMVSDEALALIERNGGSVWVEDLAKGQVCVDFPSGGWRGEYETIKHLSRIGVEMDSREHLYAATERSFYRRKKEGMT